MTHDGNCVYTVLPTFQQIWIKCENRGIVCFEKWVCLLVDGILVWDVSLAGPVIVCKRSLDIDNETHLLCWQCVFLQTADMVGWNFTFLYVQFSIHWQWRAYVLVRFRHKDLLVRLKKDHVWDGSLPIPTIPKYQFLTTWETWFRLRFQNHIFLQIGPSTKTAGSSLEVSLNIPSGYTLTDVENQFLTVVTGLAAIWKSGQRHIVWMWYNVCLYNVCTNNMVCIGGVMCHWWSWWYKIPMSIIYI